MLKTLRRYSCLYVSFARYCLIRELSFRVNFLARCGAGLVWLAILVFFFHLIFRQTKTIGEWNQDQYLFFLATGLLLNGIINTFFMDNCSRFAELIRTGNLDFALLRPIDEQFLLTCHRVDWATAPNIVFAIALAIVAMARTQIVPTIDKFVVYLLMVLAGLVILYSLLLTMAATTVWIVQNRGLYELWFYVNNFARYPADVYQGSPLGIALNIMLMFVLPVLLAVNIPARYGVDKVLSWPLTLYLFVVAGVALVGSRLFFRFALKHYRSASS